jgi:hypothetical protein
MSDRMSKRKPTPKRTKAPADDLLLRALRQVADEALEETVPERLLQAIRAARRQPSADGEPPAEPATRPDEPS